MRSAFPFMMPLASDRDGDAMDLWMKPGREAFNFWISFFPTAPFFGVEWRFAQLVDPSMNPLMMAGMPGMRAAAMAAHPGELDSPAAADEEAEKPVARAAETAGEAAAEMTRVAGEAAARTAEKAIETGAEVAKTALDAQSQAADVAEKAGKTAKLATETAVSTVEDAGTTTAIAAEEATEAAGTGAVKRTKAAEKTAGKSAEAIDEAIGAAPKPKMLLDKRPNETDDLKAIKGIGPDLERQLNNLGLYRFDQLAKMSDADLAWIDSHITRFKGRCFRDDWVGQAKSRLAK